MTNSIGNALAGHAFRVDEHKKAKQYDNQLTDLVNSIIAQRKAENEIKRNNQTHG